jgi:cytochrome P450
MASLLDLFVAGTETTSTTTLWAMVFMIENPDVLRKVQEEIDNNVGREKMLTNSERGLCFSSISYGKNYGHHTMYRGRSPKFRSNANPKCILLLCNFN